MALPCPLCSKKLWHIENGLANHVWHDHPESKISMAHSHASLMHGDPAAERRSRSCRDLTGVDRFVGMFHQPS